MPPEQPFHFHVESSSEFNETATSTSTFSGPNHINIDDGASTDVDLGICSGMSRIHSTLEINLSSITNALDSVDTQIDIAVAEETPLDITPIMNQHKVDLGIELGGNSDPDFDMCSTSSLSPSLLDKNPFFSVMEKDDVTFDLNIECNDIMNEGECTTQL